MASSEPAADRRRQPAPVQPGRTQERNPVPHPPGAGAPLAVPVAFLRSPTHAPLLSGFASQRGRRGRLSPLRRPRLPAGRGAQAALRLRRCWRLRSPEQRRNVAQGAAQDGGARLAQHVDGSLQGGCGRRRRGVGAGTRPQPAGRASWPRARADFGAKAAGLATALSLQELAALHLLELRIRDTLRLCALQQPAAAPPRGGRARCRAEQARVLQITQKTDINKPGSCGDRIPAPAPATRITDDNKKHVAHSSSSSASMRANAGTAATSAGAQTSAARTARREEGTSVGAAPPQRAATARRAGRARRATPAGTVSCWASTAGAIAAQSVVCNQIRQNLAC